MADTNKRQQSGSRKPGRPKGSGTGKGSTAPKAPVKKGITEENTGFIRAEVVIICSFAVAILLFLSNFRLCGVVGEVLRGVQLGIFGMVGYLAPVLIFVCTCFYLSNQGNFHAILKLAAAAAAILAVCGLLQLLLGRADPGTPWGEFYKLSSASGTGGGWIGGVLASLLVLGLGKPGAFLVLAVIFIICMVFITERSFVGVVKKGGGKAYRYAREDMGRRREVHAQRVEERKRIRAEQKVRGVDLEATRLGVYDNYDEEYDGEEFDREFGADLEEFPQAVDENLAMEAGAAMPDSGPVNEFRGKFDPPLNHGNGDLGLPDADAVSELARSIEGFGRQETDGPRATGITVTEEDVLASFSVPGDTFKEMDLTGSLDDGGDFDREAPWESLECRSGPEDFGPEREGMTQDSLFVPGEPKRVVTAGGKVIETETELLQKKIEKRREEAAKGGADLTVAEEIRKKEEVVKKEYIFPPTTLLKKSSRNQGAFSGEEYKATAIKLQQTLHNFGVGVTVTNISCGPAVTRYELLPEQGVKVSRIVGLADDIKLSLAAADIRIEAPIPGKSAVGIEVPNKENNVVYLRELLEADGFRQHKSRLAFAVGKDIGGQVVVTDIAKMPHLLIAGATGSGKSVCINTLIMSIIFKSKPEDVKMIMVDPKVVELSVYNGIPHLLIPVVTDPKKASGALNWAVAEMTDRYKKFAECNVRDLKGYNERVEKIKDIEDENKPVKLPQIVIIIDELADLMMVAPGEVEDSVCRLAQLARAAGIHLVIATQRPSVNVITGLIKANVPSRIAFSVSSGVDSRTIIDMNGAEKLLGKGDMLFYPAGFPKPQRVQGAFVSDGEVGRVVDFLTEQGMVAQYSPEVESCVSAPTADAGGGQGSRDEYFAQAGRFIIDKDKASIGMLQRMFKIGFNRAARMMDQLAEAGVVGEEEGTKPRKVLMTGEEFEEMMGQQH